MFGFDKNRCWFTGTLRQPPAISTKAKLKIDNWLQLNLFFLMVGTDFIVASIWRIGIHELRRSN